MTIGVSTASTPFCRESARSAATGLASPPTALPPAVPPAGITWPVSGSIRTEGDAPGCAPPGVGDPGEDPPEPPEPAPAEPEPPPPGGFGFASAEHGPARTLPQ